MRTIVTIDLTFKAGNIIEKLFWASLAVLGTIWAIYFVTLVFEDKNPIIVTKGGIHKPRGQ